MEMRSYVGAGILVAMGAAVVCILHQFPIRTHASQSTPFVINSALDEATAMLSDGRTLTLSDGILELEGQRIPLATPRRFASLTAMPTGQVLIWGALMTTDASSKRANGSNHRLARW